MPWSPGAQISMGKDTFDSGREMVSEIENEDLPMVSFVPEVTSFRFDEDNDHLLHKVSFENHALVCKQVEYETFNFEEDICKSDFKPTQVDDDSMLESFYFKDNTTLSFLEEICVDERAEACVDNHFTKSENMIEGIFARTKFEQGFSLIDKVLQHDGEDKEPDYIFICHEMEANQVLVPAKCKSSTTADSGIGVLNLDKEFSDLIATKNEEVNAVWDDPMCGKDPYFFSFGLDSEFSPESKHGERQYDAITFLELLEHSDFVKSDLSSEVFIKNGQVEEWECEYVAIPFSEICDYFSLQQRVGECMINDTQDGTK